MGRAEGASETPSREKGPRRRTETERGRAGGPDARGRPRPPGGAAARDGDRKTGRARERKKGRPPAWGSRGEARRRRVRRQTPVPPTPERRLRRRGEWAGGRGREKEEKRGREGREGAGGARLFFFFPLFLPPHPLKEISVRNFFSFFGLFSLLPPFSPRRRGNECEGRR